MRKGKPKTPKKLDLAIEVKNFGPISKGTVSLKNLTVLIGPNNSGKSYIAMLVHAFAESYSQRFGLDASTLHYLIRIPVDEKQILINNLPELEELINMFAKSINEELEIPQEISNKIIDEIYKHYYDHNLKDKIEAIYACQQKELIRIDETSYKIGITYSGNVSILSFVRSGKYMKIKNTFNADNITYYIQSEKSNQSPSIREAYSFDITESGETASISNIFIRNVLHISKENMIKNCQHIMETVIDSHYRRIAQKSTMPLSYYLPAGRTGILQSYRTLLANIVNNLTFSSTRKTEPASMQGAVVQLISDIYTMPDKHGPLYDIVVEFEHEITKGEITIKRLLPGSIPEIQYSFKGTAIPIHRTSSTISELAPIILYLKHRVEPGDIMIIEEPEAHLHPENQRLMAKLLVKLIRAGVYVIITTHSDFLLEQLSNYLLISTLPTKKKKFFETENYISTDEIGAYVFQQDNTKGGYQIREEEIDKDDGISDEEFFNVNKSLYDETVKIKDAMTE
ncbi:MAG: AAA family ATPase, partial [Nitrospirae bacterium]|nr:AAA family ATPase [Nitrospirota bacterium]